jgi:hypothetical protein
LFFGLAHRAETPKPKKTKFQIVLRVIPGMATARLAMFACKTKFAGNLRAHEAEKEACN